MTQLCAVGNHSSVMFCSQLADIYGNVMSVRLGSDKIVLVSGYKMVKEAIVAKAENFVYLSTYSTL